jgi:hypothetical protein
MKNHIEFYMYLGDNHVRVDATFDDDGEIWQYSVWLLHDDGKRYDLGEFKLAGLYLADEALQDMVEQAIMRRCPV